MKQYLKFSVLMVFLTLFGGVFAQKHSPRTYDEDQQVFRNEMNRLDSLCEASGPTKSVETATADEKWYEIEKLTLFDQAGNPTHRHSWTYIDGNNASTRNILTEVFEDYNAAEEKYVNDRRRTFKYDKNGNWTNVVIEKWDGTSWVNAHRFECIYDAKNRMTLQTQEMMYEGRWAGVIRWTNVWNDVDSCTDRMFERATEDGIWVKTMHQIWTYDAFGNLLQEGIQHLKLKEDSGYYWEGYSGWIYTYNDANHRISGISLHAGDSSARETYTNDAQGNRLSRTQEKYTMDTWVNSWRNEYTYENKRMKTQFYDRFVENKWQHKGFQTWDYDEKGNTIKWTDNSFDTITGEQYGSYRMVYTFDEDNHLLKLDQDIYFRDSNKWVDSYTEDCTYDVNGNKITEIWHSIWGSSYMKIVDLVWTYDENKNSTMIKATHIPERVAYFIYYNNSAASYGIPYFMTFGAHISYVDIRNGVPVSSITLNEKNLTLKVKETFQLEAVINPTEASNKEIRWSSSDDKIVSVSSDGLLKALESGTVTITVTTVDGGLTDECTVVSPVSIDDIDNVDINMFTSNNSIIINSNVKIMDVSVCDLTGRLVYSSNNANPIATSSWSRGIYIVKAINSNNIIKINKILVK